MKKEDKEDKYISEVHLVNAMVFFKKALKIRRLIRDSNITNNFNYKNDEESIKKEIGRYLLDS